MGLDSFATIAFLILGVAAFFGYKLGGEIVYAQDRSKRYVKPPRQKY